MYGDGFDFDFYVFWQMCDFNVGVCWEGGVMFGEECFVGGVNGSEIVEIFDEYGGFDDIVDGEVSGFNDCFYVVQ